MGTSRDYYFFPRCRKHSPKSPLRKFPNFGIRRKKEETATATARSSPSWEVIIERQEGERRSPSPPPVPPRIQPSAPPQEFPENWYHDRPPFYPSPQPFQLYRQEQQDNAVGSRNPVSPYRYCVIDPQGGFTNLTDKSPRAQERLSLPVNNCQVAQATCLGIGCYNVALTDKVNFTPTSPVISSDLISSYTIVSPLSSPGFHINTTGTTIPTLPAMSPTNKPPVPSPRESLSRAVYFEPTGGDRRSLHKAYSELSLNLPVRILAVNICVGLNFRILDLSSHVTTNVTNILKVYLNLKAECLSFSLFILSH